MNLIAYQIPPTIEGAWSLEPAPTNRTWMDRIAHNFAYRCLPMTVANQMGWIIRCPFTFTAEWNGNAAHGNIRFVVHEDGANIAAAVNNHFGNGIITFTLPWLFRTERNDISKANDSWGPKDHFMRQAKDDPEALWQELSRSRLGDPTESGLLVRGLPNYWRFNCHALEGFVETWWLPFTFTMNWKILEPHYPVLFQAGDPICFLQPFDIHPLQVVGTKLKHISEDPDLLKKYTKWARERDQFNFDPNRLPSEWQGYYHGAIAPGQEGAKSEGHVTKLKLPFFLAKESKDEVESSGSSPGEEVVESPRVGDDLDSGEDSVEPGSSDPGDGSGDGVGVRPE